jgi:hypothetical protein
MVDGYVPENSGDVHASRAADIHEEGVGRLDESALLGLGGLNLHIRVQQIVLNELERTEKRKSSEHPRVSLPSVWLRVIR